MAEGGLIARSASDAGTAEQFFHPAPYSRMDAKERLHNELDRLQKHLPKWAVGTLERVRKPGAIWVRLPLAIVLMVGGVLGFLPILGFWMVPLGLALLALDLPFLRGPLARFLGWINGKLEK